ncbi:UNVERIFIED_CONTAM: hypothetical protein Sradi_5040900 [Sesamum radiatum]|uniref:Uncharacterized protein n=1 Tax=Sesamum radiatum TaxID=300843 RepID=A0AAW2MGB1_SESRA
MEDSEKLKGSQGPTIVKTFNQSNSIARAEAKNITERPPKEPPDPVHSQSSQLSIAMKTRMPPIIDKGHLWNSFLKKGKLQKRVSGQLAGKSRLGTEQVKNRGGPKNCV